MIKKLLLLTVLGTLIYFVIGYVVFDLVLGSYSEANTTHLAGFKKEGEAFSYAALLLSCAAYAALLSYILVYLARIDSVLHGGLVAMTTGVLIAVMTDSYWYGSSHFYNSIYPLLADVAGAAVSVGLTGALMVGLGSRIRE
ncbi:MAG: hypothetical protein JST76_12860 [Bacteroidetes bacterium]|nr:hypothetical protein [Bacteroidota bacterium]